MPGVHFIQELCEIYPAAKVVCVRRDPKRWLQSAQHMSNKMTAWYMPVLMWPMPAARWFATWLELAVERTGEMGLLPFDEGECFFFFWGGGCLLAFIVVWKGSTAGSYVELIWSALRD